MTTLLSVGNFYMGIDDEKYCDLDVHLGRVTIQYSCTNSPNHGNEDGREKCFCVLGVSIKSIEMIMNIL